jgi:RNA polymerase sigma-70 factor, ECF subfamily
VHQSSELSDRELLASMQAGDEESFVTLFRRHHRDVYRFALHVTGHAETAESLTVEVFRELLCEAGWLPQAELPLQVLLLKNSSDLVIRHFWKKGRDTSQTPANSRESVNESHETTRRRQARATVFKLPLLYREVIVLCEIMGKSRSDAALLLSCTARDIDTRLVHARRLLLGELAKHQLKNLGSSVGQSQGFPARVAHKTIPRERREDDAGSSA